MFVTEHQIDIFSKQKHHKHYGKPFSHIVYEEFEDFMKSVNHKHDDVIYLFSHFLHRRLQVGVWEYYFADGSTIKITEKNEVDSRKTYSFCVSTSGIIK